MDKIIIVVVVVVVCGILVIGLWEWGGIKFGKTFSPASVRVTYNVPEYGTSGGPYKYQATLATPLKGGTLNKGATIEKIVVAVPFTVTIGNPLTNTAGYTAKTSSNTTTAGGIRSANVEVNANTPSVNPVDLSFDVTNADLAFTTGKMQIQIKYPYTIMYIIDVEEQITYIEPVPVPYHPSGTSNISKLSYDYLLKEKFITKEQYEKFISSESDNGE